MKTKTKKIFSLSVLVMCIAVFGLVGAVSAEATIEQVLDDYYGSGVWSEVTTTDEYTFKSGGYKATTVLVNKSSGYPNPTGWYEVGSPIVYNELYNPVIEDHVRNFTTSKEFGMYINSDEGDFHSEKSENPDAAKHVRLFTIPGGYVLAFEDHASNNWGDPGEPDYQDIVVELKGANLVPEFATIAIPAIAVLGLFLFFNKRKHKKE
jgi:hypothetical protein